MRPYSQITALLAITKASLRATFRSPSAVVFSFAFPLIFILVFGFLSNGSNITLFTENNSCNCGKQFKTNGGLWKHKKMCKHENITIIEDNQIDTSTLDMNMIMQLLKQNDEFKALMVEQNTKLIEAYTNQGTKVQSGTLREARQSGEALPRTPP